MSRGMPITFAKKPWWAPKMWRGCPKAIWKPNSTQQTSTSANAMNDIIIEFTDQRFCITPPYRTTRPGTLMSPTSVAAVSCHALSPGFSQLGYADHTAGQSARVDVRRLWTAVQRVAVRFRHAVHTHPAHWAPT